MTLEEQMTEMQGKLEALEQQLQQQSPSDGDKKGESPRSGAGVVPPDMQQQDALIAQMQEQASKKDLHKAQVAQMAHALQFIKEELPKIEMSSQTQAVIAAFAGDKEDYMAHRDWIMRAYLKNEALDRLSMEDIHDMPRLYQDAIKQAKLGDHFDIAHVFGMVREMEEQAKQKAQAQAKLASLSLASEISDNELEKLPQSQQMAHRVCQRHRQASEQLRWSKK